MKTKTTNNEELLTVRETSEYIRKSKSWLDQGRVYGFGPDFIRIGGSIFYCRSDLNYYIAASRVTVTS